MNGKWYISYTENDNVYRTILWTKIHKFRWTERSTFNNFNSKMASKNDVYSANRSNHRDFSCICKTTYWIGSRPQLEIYHIYVTYLHKAALVQYKSSVPTAQSRPNNNASSGLELNCFATEPIMATVWKIVFNSVQFSNF